MAHGDCTSRSAAGGIEEIQQGDLIVEGLLDCPAILAVRRASKRITLLQECLTQRTIGVNCRVEEWLVGKHIAVTVENQRAIPVRRDGNRVVGSTKCPLKDVRSGGGDTTAGSSMGNSGGSHQQATQQCKQHKQAKQIPFHSLKPRFLRRDQTK